MSQIIRHTGSKMSQPGNMRVLVITTLAFTVCFAVWMMFGVIGIPIRTALGLNSTEFGLLTATPILTGALFRLPLGIWTDRFGGRIVMFVLLLVCALPVWVSSHASTLWQLLALGLALGLVGAAFAVGTPYVARFFPKERRGFAMGFFGAGTVGAALNMFVAPWLIASFGWQSVPRVYAAALVLTAILFWLLSEPDPGAGKTGVSITEQLRVLRDPRVWKYCQYYSIVFGGFTALSSWMPQYFVSEYGLTLTQAALLAACFSLPGGVLRAFGGWLSDRFGAHSVTWWVLWSAWICLFLLSYPRSEFIVHTIDGPKGFALSVPLEKPLAAMFACQLWLSPPKAMSRCPACKEVAPPGTGNSTGLPSALTMSPVTLSRSRNQSLLVAAAPERWISPPLRLKLSTSIPPSLRSKALAVSAVSAPKKAR